MAPASRPCCAASVGFIKPASGQVRLDGADITGLAPEAITRLGLRLVLDGHRVFPELSVRDNIRLGAAFRGGRPDFESMAAPALDMFPIPAAEAALIRRAR